MLYFVMLKYFAAMKRTKTFSDFSVDYNGLLG